MAPFVALIGFMGSGKSSVGALAADLLGCRFVDLDEEIVKAEGMPIVELFARHGEADFRQREVRALRTVLASGRSPDTPYRGVVIALGGGTLETSEAAALLRDRGGVVYLDVDEPTAWDRARGEGRPLARDRGEFSRLFARRRPIYERAADWTLPVDGLEPAQLASQLAAAVGMAGACWQNSWGLRLAGTERPSTILGGRGCLTALKVKSVEVSERGARVYTITDENVSRAWGRRVLELLGPAAGAEPLVLPAGERNKTVDSLLTSWDWLAANGARRDDVVLALGGGVVGDVAGFAAATYQRGVSLWQVPTSLLAQVDSSVGGKTAIDLPAGKNLAGAFHQPDLVVIDPETLDTLPGSEYANGLGEVVKYALLAGDALFATLENDQQGIARRDSALLSDLIKSCVRYKAAVVSEDERDTGRRAVLNLGHTAAHALETGLGYGVLGHGEAVGLGLLVALAVSERLLALDEGVRKRTKALLQALGLPVSIALPAMEALGAAAARDKKAVAGSAGFVGLRAVGDPAWRLALPEGLFMKALEVIRA